MPTASLTALNKGKRAIVTGVATGVGPADAGIRTRLIELGFVPGEPVRVIATGFPGRDPIAVRLGNATFALRRHEAELVQIDMTTDSALTCPPRTHGPSHDES